MNLPNKLLDQVDKKILTLRTRLSDAPKQINLTENYQTVHIQKTPFNPLPKVLARQKPKTENNNLTNATKRQLCIRTLQQHKLLQRELEVLKKRANPTSSPQRSYQTQSYEEKVNYRELYNNIKENDIQEAKIKRRAVKEVEFKARLEKEKNILQKNLLAQEIKIQEDEIRVRKLEQKMEMAAYTQNLRAKQQEWKETITVKKQAKQAENAERQNEEMDTLVLEVIDKEDEIRLMQREIQQLKTKLYGDACSQEQGNPQLESKVDCYQAECHSEPQYVEHEEDIPDLLVEQPIEVQLDQELLEQEQLQEQEQVQDNQVQDNLLTPEPESYTQQLLGGNMCQENLVGQNE